MKQLAFAISLFLLATLSGCEVIGDIFKAGVWVGVLIVAAIVGLIIFLFARGGKK